jgi:signal peptidase I
MSVAVNADVYAQERVGLMFPANGETPNDGDLTGQCVTLLKWFFAEMCANFPSPFSARGDARYVGKRLVAQGLAEEIPYDQRRRGDVICYEYGTYGHIALQLSGGRVFEENVNIGGVARRVLSDGTVVYASRIGSENETWRHDQHVYRLKSYKEEGEEPMFNEGDRVNLNIYFYGEDKGHFKGAVGLDWKTAMYQGVFETEDSKMFLKMNEGDRGNVNAYIFGQDLKRFKASVGKGWKDAMYSLFESAEFKVDQLVNKGDVPAINAAFARTDGDTMVGKTWKVFFYEYATKYAGKGDYTPVTTQLYTKGK